MSSIAITVRDAEACDLARLLDLYTEFAEGEAELMPADLESPRALLARILADDDHHLCVASANGVVVGAAELIVMQHLRYHGRPWAVIENVVVTSSARGRGAGTRLIAHLVEIARARNCCKMQLTSGKRRIDAHRFYQRLGFRPVAEGFKLYLDGQRADAASAGLEAGERSSLA